MRITVAVLLGSLLSATSSALNIVLSNDDGWAEKNIRTFYYQLAGHGHSVVLSAPAHDRSGTGSSDAPPTPVIFGGQFRSIPPGSPARGQNETMPRFNYVNSFPVTSMRYGLNALARKFFRSPKKVDLAVAGPNVGNNAGPTVMVSGTVGATSEAAKEGYPAIAFSGDSDSGGPTAWNAPTPRYSTVYAVLSREIVQAITSSGLGGRYMPAGTFVNVNLPASTPAQCSQADDFKFVFSRIMDAGAKTPRDLRVCGNNGRLPTEETVLETPGCFASVSVGNAKTKLDARPAEQRYVYERLKDVLSCLPRA